MEKICETVIKIGLVSVLCVSAALAGLVLAPLAVLYTMFDADDENNLDS